MTNQTVSTAQDIAQAVADNAKSGKWLSCTFVMAHPGAIGGTVSVGIKAFGKWVQRIECAGMVDGIPEQKTLKSLKQMVADSIQKMADTLGQPVARTYYLVKVGADRWDMRQSRYKASFDAGKEHPHDLCATHFPAAGIRDLVATHNFDVDLSVLPQEAN